MTSVARERERVRPHAQLLAATTLRDCTTRLDTSASETNTFFSHPLVAATVVATRRRRRHPFRPPRHPFRPPLHIIITLQLLLYV